VRAKIEVTALTAAATLDIEHVHQRTVDPPQSCARPPESLLPQYGVQVLCE
jgi:hypothetical protein